MGRHGFGHCDCNCHEGPNMYGHAWGWRTPMTKDEVVGEMEDYKARLEAEITALEKRISTLKEKE